jgi:hypothetical protein
MGSTSREADGVRAVAPQGEQIAGQPAGKFSMEVTSFSRRGRIAPGCPAGVMQVWCRIGPAGFRRTGLGVPQLLDVSGSELAWAVLQPVRSSPLGPSPAVVGAWARLQQLAGRAPNGSLKGLVSGRRDATGSGPVV